MRTGDILICEQKNLFWRLIGHTAMIYGNQVLESTSLNKHTGIKGVQVTFTDQWIKRYPGKVYLRRRLGGELDADTATAFCERFMGTPYPNWSTRKGRWYLIRSAWDSWIFRKQSRNKDNDDWIFCTDLVARFYEDQGWLNNGPTSEYEPDDMEDGGKFERKLNGVRLRAMVRIK